MKRWQIVSMSYLAQKLNVTLHTITGTITQLEGLEYIQKITEKKSNRLSTAIKKIYTSFR